MPGCLPLQLSQKDTWGLQSDLYSKTTKVSFLDSTCKRGQEHTHCAGQWTFLLLTFMIIRSSSSTFQRHTWLPTTPLRSQKLHFDFFSEFGRYPATKIRLPTYSSDCSGFLLVSHTCPHHIWWAQNPRNPCAGELCNVNSHLKSWDPS